MIVASCGERADAHFIAEARDGWPHAIDIACVFDGWNYGEITIEEAA
ncbi:hypothetical protein C2W64_01911 [Brevibacillus laterosporus]|nr:hypothetical protein [Brevibacillus laterosporus]RAP30715.1 hypothetical protein C2W64_01911 [Brevibacillus laterosporus]